MSYNLIELQMAELHKGAPLVWQKFLQYAMLIRNWLTIYYLLKFLPWVSTLDEDGRVIFVDPAQAGGYDCITPGSSVLVEHCNQGVREEYSTAIFYMA